MIYENCKIYGPYKSKYHVTQDYVILTTKSGERFNIGNKKDLQYFWEKISQPFCISPGQILMTPEE